MKLVYALLLDVCESLNAFCHTLLAPVLMQRGLRFNKTSAALWVAYYEVELKCLQLVMGHRAALGMAVSVDDVDIGTSDLAATTDAALTVGDEPAAPSGIPASGTWDCIVKHCVHRWLSVSFSPPRSSHYQRTWTQLLHPPIHNAPIAPVS